MKNVDYKMFKAVKDGRDIVEELKYKFGIQDTMLPELIEEQDWEAIVSTILTDTKYRLTGVSYQGGCKVSTGFNVYHFVAEW